MSDLTKGNIPNDHMTSGDQGDNITKGSRKQLTMTRKGSLNRGKSEDTINGGNDQNGPGDNYIIIYYIILIIIGQKEDNVL